MTLSRTELLRMLEKGTDGHILIILLLKLNHNKIETNVDKHRHTSEIL